MLREMFGPERDVVRREWRRLRNEELYSLNPSSNNIRMMKSRRI
jgi:hypothetical protein